MIDPAPDLKEGRTNSIDTKVYKFKYLFLHLETLGQYQWLLTFYGLGVIIYILGIKMFILFYSK